MRERVKGNNPSKLGRERERESEREREREKGGNTSYAKKGIF